LKKAKVLTRFMSMRTWQPVVETGDEPRPRRATATTLARETGTFLFYRLGPSPIPGIAMTEMHMFGNAMRFDIARLSPFMERLLATN